MPNPTDYVFVIKIESTDLAGGKAQPHIARFQHLKRDDMLK